MTRRLEARLEASWYGDRKPSPWMRALAPVYAGLTALRRRLYHWRLLPAGHPGIPVIVVGNITVGGTGKTPLALWLGRRLAEAGRRPGFVTRGYGGRASRSGVHRVAADGDGLAHGDEAVLLARSGLPVWVGRNRLAAARAARAGGCDVVIADDGLQHLRLERDLELAVVDGRRGLGNRRLLPAGPLREPESRLETVDFVVVNGDAEAGMVLRIQGLRQVADDSPGPSLESIDANEALHAVAGIGHPDQFFDSLEEALGRPVTRHRFPDHHPYGANDLEGVRDGLVVMTEKDAVKCRDFAAPRWFYLSVAAVLAPALADAIASRAAALRES